MGWDELLLNAKDSVASCLKRLCETGSGECCCPAMGDSLPWRSRGQDATLPPPGPGFSSWPRNSDPTLLAARPKDKNK